MVQLIDLNKIDCIELDEAAVKTIAVRIEQDRLLDCATNSLFIMIENKINDAIAAAEVSSSDKLYFDFTVVDEHLFDDDYYDFTILIANCLAHCIVKDEIRDRESRLMVPDNVADTMFNLSMMRKMINNKCLCDVFGGLVRFKYDLYMELV